MLFQEHSFECNCPLLKLCHEEQAQRRFRDASRRTAHVSLPKPAERGGESLRTHCAARTEWNMIRRHGLRTRYGLQAVENCLTRPLLQDRVFSNLSRRAVEDLQKSCPRRLMKKGSVLFTERRVARRIRPGEQQGEAFRELPIGEITDSAHF